MFKRRISLLILVLALLFSSCSQTANHINDNTSSSSDFEVSKNTAQFHFIDVGQGDCIFIQNDNTNILVDAGTYSSGHRIYEYLTNIGISEIDYFITTHPHDDHIGGAETILRGFDVENVFMSTDEDDSYSFERFVDVLIEKDITPLYPEFGKEYKEGGLSFKFLSPAKDFGNPNDNSFVVLVTFGEITALLTGDAEKKVETELLTNNIDIHADILKVGHHGSRNASSSSFLRAVSPTVAVIQCGKDNSYGHPHKESLDRLEEIDCTILRTDLEGDIVLTTDGKTIIRSSGETYETKEKTTPATLRYIGNKKSKTLHIDSCPNLPGEKNKIEFQSRDDAISSGYKPCGNCNP